jgi:hypothetical protein
VILIVTPLLVQGHALEALKPMSSFAACMNGARVASPDHVEPQAVKRHHSMQQHSAGWQGWALICLLDGAMKM